jgi:hypothetical protein
MAARKRGASESFKRYRKNLKKEENELRRKLLGRVLWPGYMGTAMRYTLDGKRGLARKGKVGGFKFSAYS